MRPERGGPQKQSWSGRSGLITALAGALLGLCAVVLAAAGAHVLSDTGAGVRANWDTALGLHFYHALALIAVAAHMRIAVSPLLTATAWCFAAGVVVFSGTLYIRASAGLNLPAGLAPVGGMLLIFGWLSLVTYFGLSLKEGNAAH